MDLIIGTGLIGSALLARLPGSSLVDRKTLDLERPDLRLPEAPAGCSPYAWGTAYICAGVSGFEECEGNAQAYRVNVDGTLQVARTLIHRLQMFVVFISSRSIEWELRSAYSMHKALVEIALMSMGPHAIVRPTCKITSENVAEFCVKLAHIGTEKLEGIHRIP